MTTGNRILLYGATGYMGQLLAERAAELAEHKPPLKLELTLAGRDAKKLAEMSERLGFPYLAFELETPLARAERLKRPPPSAPPGRKPSPSAKASANQAVDRALANVAVVLNAAGPYGVTAEPLARACMRTQTHYLDIGGEYDVWSALRTLYDEAHQPEIAVVPGAGLTVLGSDLLLRLALACGAEHDLGEPHVVRVALSRVAAISRGSAKTMLESVRNGVRIHQNGKAVSMPVGALVRAFNFGADAKFSVDDPRICTAVTLADARTVNRTVNRVLRPDAKPPFCLMVPNIETYVEASSLEQLSYEIGGELSLALRSFPIKSSLDYALSFWPEGPTAAEREGSHQQVVVEVEDRYRRTVTARLKTPNSYDFTVAAALSGAAALLRAPEGFSGVLSPSEVIGPDDLKSYLDAKACETFLTFRGFRPHVDAQPLSFP